MEVYMSCNSSLYEETLTTDYATAKLLYELHKDTATIINKRYWRDELDKSVTIYSVTWRKGR